MKKPRADEGDAVVNCNHKIVFSVTEERKQQDVKDYLKKRNSLARDEVVTIVYILEKLYLLQIQTKEDMSELSLTNQVWEPGGISRKQDQWSVVWVEFKGVICSGDSKTVEATRLMHNMISFGCLLLLLKGVESDFEIMSTRAVNERRHLGNTCLNSVFRAEDNAIRARCVKVIMKHRENSPARNIAYEWWHSPRPPELFLGRMNSEFRILAEVQIQGGGNTKETFKMLRILSGATANFPELYFRNLEEKAMELIPEEELEASSRGGYVPPADKGALKIARFKRQKVAESNLLEIKERKERRGRSTKAATLSTHVEYEEDILDDDREEEKIEWLSTINLAICKAIDLVEMQGMLSAIKEKQLKNGEDEFSLDDRTEKSDPKTWWNCYGELALYSELYVWDPGEFNSYIELGQGSTTKEKDQEMPRNKIEWGNYGTSVEANGMSLQLMVNGFAILNWQGTDMIKVQDTELSQSEQGSVESSGCINLEDKVVIHGGSIDRIQVFIIGLILDIIIMLIIKPISV